MQTLEYLLSIKDQATATLDKFGKSAAGVSKSLDKTGKKLNDAGMGMVKLGAAGVASMGLAAKSAIDFESSFAGIRKTVDASEAEFKQLEKNIRNIAKTTPTTTNELNQIGEMAGQLGVSGVGNLTKFIDTIAKVGVTTNMTGETAATAFARISNIMGEPIDNVDRMASSVVDLGNNFATTEGETVEFANRIAGAGKIAGLTTADIFGIGAAMSSVGVQAEAGGTAVQKMLLDMNTSVVTGGDNLALFAETAGVTTSQFADMWENDAGGAFTAFVEGLGKQGDTAITTLDNLGMADQRLIRSFLSLANAGDVLSDAVDTSSNAFRDNTALTEEARKRFATTASQMAILRNNINDVSITIGNALLPAINKLIEKIKPVIEKFGEFAEKHPNVVVAVLAIVSALAVLGVILIFVGSVITSVSAILPVAAAAIGAISIPVLIVIAIIAALIAIGYLLWKNWDTIKAKAAEVGSAIKTKLTEGWGSVKQFFSNMLNFGSKVATAISSGASTAGSSITSFFSNLGLAAYDGVTKMFENIKTIFTGAVALLMDGDIQGEFLRALGLSEDSPIIQRLMGFREKVIAIFGQFVEGVKLAIAPFAFIWHNIVFPVLFLAFAVITRILYEMALFFYNIFVTISTHITTAFVFIWEQTQFYWNMISIFIFELLNTIYNGVFIPFLESAKAIFTTMWTLIKTITITIWNLIKAFIMLHVAAIQAIFTAFKAAATAIFNALWNVIKSIWSGIASTVTAFATQAKTTATQLFTTAKTNVVNIFTQLWSAIKSLGEKIYEAIVSPFKRALNKIMEIASKIKEAARKISPFHKSSPSLVELVHAGVDKIKRDYASLNKVEIPTAQNLSGVNSYNPLMREVNNQSPTSNVTNTINVDATINTPMDAEELAMMLGVQLNTAGAY